MSQATPTVTDDTTITGPYVLARINVTSAPAGYTNFTPFVCWGVYNVKTQKTLRKPEPGTLTQAIRDVIESPGMERYLRAMFSDIASPDLVLALTVMDITGVGPSPSQITASTVEGSFGTLRFSYADLRRAEKAQNLAFDVARLAERCGWTVGMTTEISEEDGETIPDLAPCLDMSLHALHLAHQKTDAYVAATALENLITATQSA